MADSASKRRYAMFAGYNQWANERLYDAAARLTDEQYRRDCGAFFKSVHGTLNHLLVTDLVWLQRCAGDSEVPTRLDAILHEDLAELQSRRVVEDRRLVSFIEQLQPHAFEGVIRYRRVSTPDVMEQPLGAALDHWFNHQTHHRGQAHVLLTQMVGAAPELDLLFYQRSVPA